MATDTRERFIQLLEEDLAHLRQAAAHWEELRKQGARLEDLDGKVIATADEKLEEILRREEELLQLIAMVRGPQR